MYFLYILECSDGAFYTGITNDVQRRFNQHKKGQGGRYTSTKEIVSIIYTEEHPDRLSALRREAQIKKWRRQRKLDLAKDFLKNSDDTSTRQESGPQQPSVERGRTEPSRPAAWKLALTRSIASASGTALCRIATLRETCTVAALTILPVLSTGCISNFIRVSCAVWTVSEPTTHVRNP